MTNIIDFQAHLDRETEHSRKIREVTSQLVPKQAEADELAQKLKRSLALADIWPGLWDGTPKVTSMWKVERNVMTYVVTRDLNGSSEQRYFKLSEVPPLLRSLEIETRIKRETGRNPK